MQKKKSVADNAERACGSTRGFRKEARPSDAV